MLSSSSKITGTLTAAANDLVSTPAPNPYPFLKPHTHFEEKEEVVQIPDGLTYHAAFKVTKKRKRTQYIKTSNTSVHTAWNKRVTRVSTLGGELFRLLDRHLPKYRIHSDGKQESPISKEIPKAQEFHTYFNAHIRPTWDKSKEVYTHNPVMQGMGRGIFGKYFYVDIDFHDGNAFLDEKNYFIVIDHDRIFGPFTAGMHDGSHPYNTTLHVYDYNQLPLLKHAEAGSWGWNKDFRLPGDPSPRSYYEAIAGNEEFKNEKHLAVLKVLITQHIQFFLVRYHLVDEDDKRNIQNLLKARFDGFTAMLPRSSVFIEYLQANRTKVMEVILFEIDNFFKENRHYQSSDQKVAQQEFQTHAAEMIQRYSALLNEFKQPTLSTEEKAHFMHFAEQVNTGDVAALARVKHFYEEQEMTRFAAFARECELKSAPAVAAASLEKAPAAEKDDGDDIQHPPKRRCIRT